LAFLEEVRFSALLDLPGEGFCRVMIPVARLILTYQLKILLGIGSINLVPTTLFRERALLKLIGYTTLQLQAGCCQRGLLALGQEGRCFAPGNRQENAMLAVERGVVVDLWDRDIQRRRHA
jgi:hypothetical protein